MSPRRRSRVTELCWGRTVNKGMFLNVGGRRAETGMIECQMAASCRGEMQRLEMCVDRRLWAGMMGQAVDVMMTSKVCDDQTGRRHEQDRWGMLERDHAAPETQWQPPWSRHVVGLETGSNLLDDLNHKNIFHGNERGLRKTQKNKKKPFLLNS